MKLKRLLGIARFGAMIFISTALLVGCGGKSDKEKDKDKDHVKGRDRAAKVAVFNARVRQLHETLNQLEGDLDIQRNRIATARNDLEGLQQAVASLPGGPLMAKDASLTATEQLASVADRIEKHQVPDYEKENAEKKTINRLLLILFLVALGIIGWWFWQSHRERTDDEFDQAWDIPPSDSGGTGESFVVPPPSHPASPQAPPEQYPPADR